jgi:thioredoxin-related protein
VNSLIRKIELVANLAIIVVAILLGVVLVRSFFFSRSRGQSQAPASIIQPGTQLSLPGTDWKANGRTLILALSTECHFCTESAPFYQQLSQRRGSAVKLVAVFPQPIKESQAYLTNLGVATDDMREAPLAALDIGATPTIILADDQGKVISSWRGKLTAEKEAEVLSKIR